MTRDLVCLAFLSAFVLARLTLTGGGGSSENLLTVTAPRGGGQPFVHPVPQSVYKRGEDISATLTATNTGGEPVSVYHNKNNYSDLGIYGNRFNFYYLVDDTSQRVVTFAPGESKTYTLGHTQSTIHPEDRFVAGRYQLDAWLTGSLTGFEYGGYRKTSLASGRLNIQITG